MFYRTIAFTAVAVCLGSAVKGQEARFTGCYDLHLTEWQPRAPGWDSTYGALPARIRLSTDSASDSFGRPANMVTVVPGAMPSGHRYSWWHMMDEERVEIVWSMGLAGVRAVLDPIADGLRGEAASFTDVVPSTTHVAVLTAYSVPCAAPIPPGRQLYHRYPRSLHLASGDSIVLGEPLPRHAAMDSVSPRWSRSSAELAPPYHDAELVETVRDQQGHVKMLRVHYPSSVSSVQIAQRLEELLGSPTNYTNTPVHMAIWASRTVSVAVYPKSLERYGPMVVFLRWP